MKASESIAEISKALSTAWGEMGNPKHNKKVEVRMKSGGKYNFEYTDLGGIIDNVKPHFKKNGISIMQSASTELVENKLYVNVSTKMIHSSGEWMESKPLTILANNSIQDMGGQITYLKRYSLSAMLGISTEEDDDANGTMGNQVTYQNAPNQQQAPPKQVGKAVILAKFKQGGGTDEQFSDWYAKQLSAGVDHNTMDVFLLNKLQENKKAENNVPKT